MEARSILLVVADPQALVQLSETLGTGWMPTPVRNDTEALAQLEKYSFDALLVDFNLGSPDASELLNQALEKRPETTRFLLAYEADLALVAAKVLGDHQILPKPIEYASLKSRIEEGVAAEKSKGQPSGSERAAEATPAIPAVYSEVLKAFESPGVTSKQVGEIIGQDAELTAEVLRLTASTSLGLPLKIAGPVEAVEALGMEAVKALVMALRFLAERSHSRPGYLSFEQVWQHSTQVAQIARDLVLFETKDRALASEAFAAGLVHDLGKVVLVTNFDDLYGRVHSLARNQPVALWEVEKEMFGANHGEIGGCLVGMWNLPGPVVEATALHHEPPVGEQQQLTPLAAVHIANVLAHQLSPSDGYQVAPIVNTAVLNELGLLERLPVWNAALAKRGAAKPGRKSEAAESNPFGTTAVAPQTANQLPGPVAATRTATSGQPESGEEMPAVLAPRFGQRRWVYTGIAATVLLVLTLWLSKQSELSEPALVNARTRSELPAGASRTQPSEPAPAVVPEATTDDIAWEQSPAMTAPTAPAPPPTPPAPEPTPAKAPAATVANVPPPTTVSPPAVTNAAAPILMAAKKALGPVFRLSGIFYSATRPAAIVNGETVHVGDWVNGATVVRIGMTNVTVQVDGRLKTYELTH